MSFISKDHFNMALKGIKRLIDQVSKNIIQSDWSETDKSSKAYIQNKPFEENGIEYVFVDLEDAPVSGATAATLSSRCEYELIPGNIYRVIINGVEKEIECVVTNVYPNRKCLMLDTDSSHSNKVIFQDNNKSYIYSFTAWDNGASVKVIGRTQPIIRLSEKFIPDSIARKTDIPGVAIKSQTATVGQTIVVSKVDFNGKPVEWEYIDPWVLIDQNTSIRYRLSVIEGKLTMDIVESEV